MTQTICKYKGNGSASVKLYDQGFDFQSMTIDGKNITTLSNYYVFGDTNEHEVIYNSDSDITNIDEEAFYICARLTSITIPNSVTSIGISAFRYCESLSSIIIPDSVTSISTYAFHGCTSLTSITIGNGITSISGSAFRNCESLSSITISAMTAPTIKTSTFRDVKTNGTLYIREGATGYDTWMGTGNYYLGMYGWTLSTFYINKLNVKGTTYNIKNYNNNTISNNITTVNNKNQTVVNYMTSAGGLTNSLTDIDERLTTIERILTQLNTLRNS